MATINDLSELLAWGSTPSWVENQFSHNYKSGTATGTGTSTATGKKSNGWGGKKSYTYTYTYTYTYDTYGLTDISTGSDTFSVSDWDDWDAETQGSNAAETFENGGYGITVDEESLTLTQDSGDITFGTAIIDTDTVAAASSSGAEIILVLDNVSGASTMTVDTSMEAEYEVSNTSSISNGYESTESVDVSAEVSAEFLDIGVSVNSDVSDSTTISTSSTEDSGTTKTYNENVDIDYSVPTGYKVQLKVYMENQEVILPFSLPVSVSGTVDYSDDWGNTWSMEAGENITSSIYYGAPNAEYMSASSDSEGELEVTGYITNVNQSTFTTVATTLVSPEDSTSSRSERTGRRTPHVDLPTVLKDGVEIKTGIHYDLSETENARGHFLLGSRNDDIIYMGAKNQKVRTFSGSDTVYGSKHADKIFSRGDDHIYSGKGDDIIKSTTGSTDIHAGPGADQVNISSKGGGFDDITLGIGIDQLNINLSKDDDYSFFVRDLHRKESVNITSEDLITAKVKGNTVEVFIDGDHVGSIAGYVHRFNKFSHFKGAEMGLMNMDKIEAGASTDTVVDWKNDLIAAGALTGWSSLNKNYKKFTKTGSEFTSNSEALSRYMYDGEIVDEFIDAMNDVIGDSDITDMSDHIAKAVLQLSTDQQDHFVPDLLL